MSELDHHEASSDWTDLEALWSREATPRAGEDRLRRLRQRVERRLARRRAWLILEVSIPLVMLVVVADLAIERSTPIFWAAFAYTIAVVTGGLIFSLHNHRSAFRHDLEAPEDALAAARLDLRRRRRAIRFGYGLLALHGAFFAMWIPLSGPVNVLRSLLFLGLWLAVFTVGVIVVDRRSRREEIEIRALERELSAGNDQT